MADRRLIKRAIEALRDNPEQYNAVHEAGHCVVTAGPGSGKTRTLTTAMARALIEDVAEPRGIACITYNNECAFELEQRLLKLGIEPSSYVFIGTVHSFALSQIISPYARAAMPELGPTFRVATRTETEELKAAAYSELISPWGDWKDRWKAADTKRRRDVDRTDASWRGRNVELADLIESYEGRLHASGLIDLDDMPLIAFRMVQEHTWIRRSLHARFPILFVDEYQDLGRALHELVMLLCFDSGIRLFAVGDVDQSVYGFLGATPSLLTSIAQRADVVTYPLRINYRSRETIVQTSFAALGEERDYHSSDEGAATVGLHGVAGGLRAQASYIVSQLIPEIQARGIRLEEIAILYRTAAQGDIVSTAAIGEEIPVVRADNNALVRRSSRLSRLVESIASWVTGGWKDGSPRFESLVDAAIGITYGDNFREIERLELASELAIFLHDWIGKATDAHAWLQEVQERLIQHWRRRSRTVVDEFEWDSVRAMIDRTNPASGDDLPLSYFAGRIEGSGRLNLSTLHSVKGREFDAAVLFGMNDDIIPNWAEKKDAAKMREARRLFYVGVTRPRLELHFVYQNGNESSFLAEVRLRVT